MRKVRERFLKYHRDNPHVYDLFKEYARKVREDGLKKFSARGVFDILRWRVAFETKGEFKVGNDVSPYYARMLIHEDPTFAPFFTLRQSDADGFDVREALHHPPPDGMR